MNKGFIRYRYKNEYEYSYWYNKSGLMMVVDPRRLPIGTVVTTCVFKENKPEKRGTFIVKEQLPSYSNSGVYPQNHSFYSKAELGKIKGACNVS